MSAGFRESHRVWCRWPLRRSRHGSRFELPTYRRCPRLRSPLAGHPRANAIDAVTRRLLGTRRVALSPASEIARPRSRHLSRTRACGTSCCSPFQNRLADESHSECRIASSLFLGLVLIPAACLASIMTVYWSAPGGSDNCSAGGAQNESGGCRRLGEIRHGKICSWCPNVHRGDTPRTKLAPGDEKRTVPTWEWRLERIHTWVLSQSAKRPRSRYNNLRQSKQAECATRRKMLVGRHRRRKIGQNRRSRTQKKRQSHGGDYS